MTVRVKSELSQPPVKRLTTKSECTGRNLVSRRGSRGGADQRCNDSRRAGTTSALDQVPSTSRLELDFAHMQPAVDQDGWWGAQDATAAPPAQSHDGPRLWSDEAGAAPVEHTPVQYEALPGQQHRPMMPPASQPSYPTQNGYPAQRGPPAQPKSGRQPLISQEESFRRSGGGFVSSNRGGGGMGGYGGGQGYGNGGGGYRQGPPTYQGNGAPYQQMQQPRFNHAPPPMRQYDLSRPPSFPPVETMQHGWGGALDVTPAPLPFVSQVNPHAPAFVPAPPPVLAVSPVVVDRDLPPHQSPDLSSPKSPLRSRQTSPVQPLQPAEPLVATLSNDGTRFWSVEAAEDVAPAAPDKSTSSSRWASDAPVEPTVVVKPALAVVAEPSPIAAGAPQDDSGAPAAAPIEAISTPFEDSPRWWSEEPTAPAPAPKPASASRPPPRSQSSYSNGSAPQGRPFQGQGRGGFAPNGRGGGGGRGGYGNVNGQGFPPNGQQQGPRSNNQQQQQQQQQRYNPSQQQSNPSSLPPSETTQEGSSGEGQSSPSEPQTSIGDSTVPSAPSSNSSRSGPPVRKQTRNVTSPASFPSQPRSTPPVQSLVRVDELATTLTEDGARFWSKEATEAEVAPAPVVQTTSSSRWATEAPVDAIRTPAPPAPAPAPVSCAPKVTVDSNEAVARTAPKVFANASTLPSAPVAIPVEATAADVVAAAARRAYPDRNRAATGGSARVSALAFPPIALTL